MVEINSRSSKHLIRELVLSFLLGLFPALALLVLYIAERHYVITSSEALWCYVISLIVVTAIIFIYKQSSSKTKRVLSNVGGTIIGLLFLLVAFNIISGQIICNQVGGEYTYNYPDWSYDINGTIHHSGNSLRSQRDTVCIIPTEKVPEILQLQKSSFFYKLTAFMVRK